LKYENEICFYSGHVETLKYEILWLRNNIIVTSQKPNGQLKDYNL